ncbi:hypothetical protein Btru_056394 [Bulinus truncatus]|nr:hypothetical protein Btru_056394 [Bulinus truncatus]
MTAISMEECRPSAKILKLTRLVSCGNGDMMPVNVQISYIETQRCPYVAPAASSTVRHRHRAVSALNTGSIPGLDQEIATHPEFREKRIYIATLTKTKMEAVIARLDARLNQIKVNPNKEIPDIVEPMDVDDDEEEEEKEIDELLQFVFDELLQFVFDELLQFVFDELLQFVFDELLQFVFDELRQFVFDELLQFVFDELLQFVFDELLQFLFDELLQFVFDELLQFVFDELLQFVFDELLQFVFDELLQFVFDELLQFVFDELLQFVFDELLQFVFDELLQFVFDELLQFVFDELLQFLFDELLQFLFDELLQFLFDELLHLSHDKIQAPPPPSIRSTINRRQQPFSGIAWHAYSSQPQALLSVPSPGPTPPSPGSTRSKSWTGRPIWLEREYANRIKVPHTFVVHNYKKPTQCQYCKKLLKGIIRQGVQCKDCKFNCHRKCSPLVPNDCAGELTYPGNEVLLESLEHTEQESEEPADIPEVIEDGTGSLPDEDDTEDVESKPPLSPIDSSNIPLMRVVQSVKHTKRAGSRTLKEGWMVHFTDKENMRKRHYWRLDPKSIIFYSDEKTTRYFKVRNLENGSDFVILALQESLVSVRRSVVGTPAYPQAPMDSNNLRRKGTTDLYGYILILWIVISCQSDKWASDFSDPWSDGREILNRRVVKQTVRIIQLPEDTLQVNRPAHLYLQAFCLTVPHSQGHGIDKVDTRSFTRALWQRILSSIHRID